MTYLCTIQNQVTWSEALYLDKLIKTKDVWCEWVSGLVGDWVSSPGRIWGKISKIQILRNRITELWSVPKHWHANDKRTQAKSLTWDFDISRNHWLRLTAVQLHDSINSVYYWEEYSKTPTRHLNAKRKVAISPTWHLAILRRRKRLKYLSVQLQRSPVLTDI